MYILDIMGCSNASGKMTSLAYVKYHPLYIHDCTMTVPHRHGTDVLTNQMNTLKLHAHNENNLCDIGLSVHALMGKGGSC
jgi:hypothetical protein